MSALRARAETTALALDLRREGLSTREIAARLGLSAKTIRAYLGDPDGAKDRARKLSYGGTCERCGGRTDGSNGPAKAPRMCLRCRIETMPRAAHGTHGRYDIGCRCAECREAMRLYMRSLKDKEAPNHGTASGYFNYGCRCDPCKRAGSEKNRLRYTRARLRALNSDGSDSERCGGGLGE